MAMLYNAKSGASFVVPTTGTHETEEMSGDYGLCIVYVEFFSDSIGKAPATPTAGTVTAEVSALGNVFVPMVAHSGRLYAVVASNTAIAHVKVGV